VAVGEARGPPYGHVRTLCAWLIVNWRYLRGRLRLVGQRIETYSFDELIDVAYAALADGFNGLVDPQEVRNKIDESLDRSFADRESWGTSPTAEAAQAAMMEGSQARLREDAPPE
jgi:hypothetical protein